MQKQKTKLPDIWGGIEVYNKQGQAIDSRISLQLTGIL